jgi:hypothetical protein
MLARREAVSMRPSDDELWVAAAAAGAHPQPSPSEQHHMVRRAATYAIDSGADAVTSASAQRIGTAAIGRCTKNWQQSETECRRMVDGDWRADIE